MDFAIIAAGQGSRLSHEGIDQPKPLVNLCGQPMIKRLIDIFLECGASSVSIITNPDMPQVKDYLATLSLPVSLNVIEKSTPSSMHSFHELSKFLTAEKFCLTTVDTIFRPEEFKRYVKAFESDESSDGLMAVTTFIDDEKPLYVDIQPGNDMRISAFNDTPSPGVNHVSGGIYGLRHKALDILDHCMQQGIHRMRNYQRALLATGLDIKAYPFEKIIDVDHAADIATARNFLQ